MQLKGELAKTNGLMAALREQLTRARQQQQRGGGGSGERLHSSSSITTSNLSTAPGSVGGFSSIANSQLDVDEAGSITSALQNTQ